MEKPPPKPKKCKGATREDLLNMDKNDLVDRILQLEAHNLQLKNIISKNLSDYNVSEKLKTKEFDFSSCKTRRVLLRIMYFGWNYQGLAVQEDSNQTIEHNLFYALKKSCLIESRETSNYHRCGRTDKGVSSFGQVISISLRCNQSDATKEYSVESELPYCKILNRLLPKDIRAVCWMPIPDGMPDYSARFDCKRRQYKYYFPRSSLDLAAMRDACSRLIGSRDFRHLCKMDVGNGVTEFIRHVFKADIVAVDEENESPYTMYYLLIEGNAFLWHQIRCIMGVLLLIGQRREMPDIITELLDYEKNPRKPQYSMALDVPLNLFHCSYDIEKTYNWYYEREELKCIIIQMQGEWTLHNIKSTIIQDTLRQLEKEYEKQCKSESQDLSSEEIERDGTICHADCLLQGVKPKVYKPLLKRETCSSLQERIEYYKKKRKL